jgi:hypothetical protein
VQLSESDADLFDLKSSLSLRDAKNWEPHLRGSPCGERGPEPSPLRAGRPSPHRETDPPPRQGLGLRRHRWWQLPSKRATGKARGGLSQPGGHTRSDDPSHVRLALPQEGRPAPRYECASQHRALQAVNLRQPDTGEGLGLKVSAPVKTAAPLHLMGGPRYR